MKKQIIALSALLTMASGLYGAAAGDILKSFEFGYNQTFNKDFLLQEPLNLRPWNNALEDMEQFVTESSKNLVGNKDPLLLKGLAEIKNANADIISIIETIQTTLPSKDKVALRQNINPIAEIKTRMDDAKDRFNKMSFTLAKKKDAQELLVNAASYIEKIATKVRVNLLKQIEALINY
ncbi:MAG TPA: hypothetical protein VKR54_05190 [Candidatus Babeliales bacterium]|jgi:hypothetical protein|nr:hypothetical protein [Candidatus Babeliales bacterium]